MSSLQGSLDKKIVVATWHFKMVAIFQDGRHPGQIIKWCDCYVGDIGMKIGTTSLHEALNKKMLTPTWNSKMAGIFQDGHYLSAAVKWCNHSVGDT